MKNPNKNKKIQLFIDVDSLKERQEAERPASGDYLYDYKLAGMKKEVSELSPEEFHKKYKINFRDLPISKLSVHALTKRKFIKMTEIQRCVIPQALAGRDVLGASKTGSGKTLSYLVPLIERLYTMKWTPMDGLGALIILPTRELAIQVFENFNSIANTHELSVALLIGGKNYQYEKDNIHYINVLICTPGRLLQHMQESPGFEAANLQMLVLDEADMILEFGFEMTVNSIIENLPTSRQTMLFSATLTKDIQSLARLSLNNPEMIFLNLPNKSGEKTEGLEENQAEGVPELLATPHKLLQYYMIVNIGEKLDTLFSFLKSHQKSKCLVFLSSCKQVRFVYESFRKLRIGTPLFELHGRQKQSKRMAIFFTYTEKKYATLFTTNIAARGLDFPSVDWIVQVDCPENIVTYVHRVGRTARYKAGGKALLLLLPSEQKMIENIKDNKIIINKINSNPKKALTIKASLQAFITEDIDLKYLAQRAFISYMRSVFLSPDKEIFDVHALNPGDFAESLGLLQTPLIRFKKVSETPDDEGEERNTENAQTGADDAEPREIKKKLSKQQKMKEKIKMLKEQRRIKKESDLIDPPPDNSKVAELEPAKKEKSVNVKNVKQQLRTNNTVLSDKFERMRNKVEQPDEEEEFLVKKRTITPEEIEAEREKYTGYKRLGLPMVVSKRQLKKIKPEGHFGGRNKIKFNKEGKPVTEEELRLEEFNENLNRYERENTDFTDSLRRNLLINKEEDEEAERKRVKLQRRKKKLRFKEKEMERHACNQIAVLGDEDGEEPWEESE